jgi:uncharacterized integral membrane protein (TIGR00698 family)
MAACALPVTGTPAALAAGACFGLLLGNPWPARTAVWSKKLLQLSVVGLGFGLGLGEVLRTGRDAFTYTIIGIVLTMLVGRLLGRFLGVPSTTTTLISFGTAICGGSAIAAMAPVIRARDDETAVALATVFSLNAVALLLFPPIGHLAGLSQQQFGLWAALAIHDTSSVVGAAAAYGATALAVGTTVKLARAVWIMPCSLAAAWLNKSEERAGIPLFIPGFVAATALRAALPQALPLWDGLFAVARQSLVVTLFLIGAGLSRQLLRRLGVRPLLLGVLLWLSVSLVTLAAILKGWIG